MPGELAVGGAGRLEFVGFFVWFPAKDGIVLFKRGDAGVKLVGVRRGGAPAIAPARARSGVVVRRPRRFIRFSGRAGAFPCGRGLPEQ